MSAARLAGDIGDGVDDGLAAGQLADEIDAIVHELTELLGNPHLIAAPVPNVRSPFAAAERFFKDPMITAAAIDGLVRHAIVLAVTGRRIRVDHAQAERTAEGATPPTNLVAPTTPPLDLIPSPAPTAPGSASAMTTNEAGSNDV